MVGRLQDPWNRGQSAIVTKRETQKGTVGNETFPGVDYFGGGTDERRNDYGGFFPRKVTMTGLGKTVEEEQIRRLFVLG